MLDTIIIHTNEIVLKGHNRHFFEKRLLQDISRRLKRLADFRLERNDGSEMVFYLAGGMTDEQLTAVRRELGMTFGIAGSLLGERCGLDINEIAEAAVRAASAWSGTFKVFTKRRNKQFPMKSMDICARVGGMILEANSRLKVDVHEPDHEIRIEVDQKYACVGAESVPGAGGLPSGCSGKVVALLSGGIDSPVSSWKMMRRGCTPVFVHFHSYPYVGRESLDKAERLAGILAKWLGEPVKVWFVSIADLQREIVAKCTESYRVVLYRRAMVRLAERIAAKEEAKALITGDAVGQVASQTLDNLRTVSAVATLPIFRPLVGDDKEDIIRVARHIGTFGVSIERHDDCCSLFMPNGPVLSGQPEAAADEEKKLDLEGLLETALAGAESRLVG